MKRLLFAGLFAVSIALLGLLPCAATAEPGPWTVPSELFPLAPGETGPSVEAGPDGSITAVWMRGTSSGPGTILSATRDPSGMFGPPVKIGTGNTSLYSPAVVTGTDGTTAVVWSDYDFPRTAIKAVVRPPGGSFGPPETLVEVESPGGS